MNGNLDRNWNDRERSRDVAVVGAGLAGLAAAARIARLGRDVLLLEKARSPGGRASTRERGGFAFNQGPHALYRKGEGMRVLRDLGIHPRGALAGAVGSFAFDRGTLHTLPGGFVSLLTTGLLSLPAKIELARLLARVPRLDAAVLEETPLAAWIEGEARDPTVRRLLTALSRVTTYCADDTSLSAAAALRQLQSALDGGVLYLDGGWQTLVDGLSEVVRGSGGAIEAHARAIAVERSGEGYRVSISGERSIRARAVVLALPAPATAELLPGAVGGTLRRRAETARPVRLACLDLALSSVPRPKARFALGVDRPLYFSLHSAVARLAPEGGGLIHAARYLGDGEDPAGSDRELETLVDRLQPGWRRFVVERRFLPEMVVASDVPRADAGGAPARPPVAVADLPGLFLAGDWVGPRGLLADASLASADAAAHLAVDHLSLSASRPAA